MKMINFSQENKSVPNGLKHENKALQNDNYDPPDPVKFVIQKFRKAGIYSTRYVVQKPMTIFEGKSSKVGVFSCEAGA